MAQPTPPPPMGSRHSNLKKSFQIGVRSLLTSFSKEDVQKAFSTFTNAEKESLYRMFVQVIKSLHENIEVEFETICKETQVGTTLDMIEQLVEEKNLDMLSADKTDIRDVMERVSRVKKDEIHQLTSLIAKVEEENSIMKAHIESMKSIQDIAVSADVRNFGAGLPSMKDILVNELDTPEVPNLLSQFVPYNNL